MTLLLLPLDCAGLQVPGVGPVTKDALLAAGVNTSHQLIGVYLSYFREKATVKGRVNEFHAWLKSVGASAGHVNAIVRAVVEKVNVMFPGTYNAEEAV